MPRFSLRSLLLCIAVAWAVPGVLAAESFFGLAVIERSPTQAIIAVVHRADDSSTPTASWAPLVVASDRAFATFDRLVPNPALRAGERAPRVKPLAGEEGTGHEFRFLVAVDEEGVPGTALRDGEELMRFRVRLRDEPVRIILAPDETRGGLRSWNGRRSPTGQAPLAALLLLPPNRGEGS
ncbi:MAG: hypothetical protein PWP23_611 [Candidatus Sumerlaeota bacterium]|nr:hypothetical protein [Candidatus Sumerlaeota bacterium]